MASRTICSKAPSTGAGAARERSGMSEPRIEGEPHRPSRPRLDPPRQVEPHEPAEQREPHAGTTHRLAGMSPGIAIARPAEIVEECGSHAGEARTELRAREPVRVADHRSRLLAP